MKTPSMLLSKKILLTIYKFFVTPFLNYTDIIYDKPCNESFKGKLDAVQYNACIALTGKIRGTPQKCLYCVLRSETVNDRRWSRKVFLFHKIIKAFFPSYLENVFVMCNTARRDLNL